MRVIYSLLSFLIFVVEIIVSHVLLLQSLVSNSVFILSVGIARYHNRIQRMMNRKSFIIIQNVEVS